MHMGSFPYALRLPSTGREVQEVFGRPLPHGATADYDGIQKRNVLDWLLEAPV